MIIKILFVIFVTLQSKSIYPFLLVNLMLLLILSFCILIFGAFYMCPLFMAIDISLLLLMTIVDFYGLFCSKLSLKFPIMFNPSLKWFRLNSMSPPNVTDMIMAMNFSFLHFMSHMVFCIKNLVLKLPNKMVELKENINIF